MDTSVELKSKHEQMLDTIALIIEKLIPMGITHQVTDDAALEGRKIHINGKELVNFSSCSYLGLEQDKRLKTGAIDAIHNYGTSFSSTRAYLSSKIFNELEVMLEDIFKKPVLLATSTMLGHISCIPVIVGDQDLVILDNSVHASVHTTVDLLKARHIPVELIRHSNYEMLEEKIRKHKNHYNKIWFMSDGVHSMYGDIIKMGEINRLLNEYDNFYAYIDDVHGMGWTGPRGSGSVMAQGPLHEKVFLATGLSKSFAAFGGVLVLPDEKIKNIIKYFGKSMTFCTPIQPPTLGAANASAKIHLSGELDSLQKRLIAKIKLFNSLAHMYDIPLYSDDLSPVRFICLGKPETGYYVIKSLMQKGFYTSISCYPSVPYNQTGMRVPITLLHSDEDIEKVVKNIAEILPAALKETDSNINDVYRAFKMKVTNRI
jgi:7-keto-8-aminopelargonate synthetase-like enzyme